MKILVYGLNFYPELTGIGKYTGEMAFELQARGHEVRVISAPPYYPEWKVAAQYKNSSYRKEIINEVSVYRCPLWVPTKPSGLKRIVHLMSFAATSSIALVRQVKWRPDLIFIVEPTLACAPLGLLLGFLVKSKTLLHVQDLEVDAAFDLGLVKSSSLRKFISLLETFIYKRFFLITTISGEMRKKIVEKGLPESRVKIFRNWVDVSNITPLKRSSEFRVNLNIPVDSLVCLYSGNMGKKQGLEILAGLAKRLAANSKIFFLFCGAGGGRAGLEEACSGFGNVRFLDLQPLDLLNELLCTADVHLLPQRADVAALVLPSKLTGMMASGRPVVVTAEADTELARVVVKDAKCGLAVRPGRVEDFAEAILRLAEDKDLREKMGTCGRRYAEETFAKKHVIDEFEKIISEISR